MGFVHIVEEAEHLPGVAARFGFPRHETLLDHPENAALKKLRKNPNILLAGDRVFIPDLEDKSQRVATDRRHRFVLAIEALELHVKVHDQGFVPIHGDALLAVGTVRTPMPQNGDVFEGPIAPAASAARLTLANTGGVRQGPITLAPGRLDPIDQRAGQQQRLNNLGYFAGFVTSAATSATQVDPQFQWAVEEFQCDHLGPAQVDGVVGPATLKKLAEVHGC